MKLVFNVPLGLDIGRPFKREPISTGTAVALTAANIAANAGAAGLSANAAAANSHHGRIYARWALHRQEEENERARQFQMSESQKAREWEEMMYKQYNSPSAMMRQYREAGLNPYLAGQDGVGSPMSGSAPMSPSGASGLSPTTPPQFMPDFSSIGRIGSDIAGILGVDAQIANQRAQTKRTLIETYLDLRYKGDYKQASEFADANGIFRDESAYGGSIFEQEAYARMGRDTQEGYRAKVEAGFVEQFGKQKADKELSLLAKQIDLMSQQISTLQSQESLNYASGRRVASEIARNFAAVGLDKVRSSFLGDLKRFVVDQAAISAGISGLQYLQMDADYEGGELVRDFIRSDKGKLARKYSYIFTPQGNFILGFSQGLNDFLKPIDHVTPFITPWSKPSSGSTFNINPSWQVGY